MSLMVILFPALIALAVAFIPNRAAAPIVAAGSGIITFILSLFLTGDTGIQSMWLPGFGATFSLAGDGAASVLVMVASLVMVPTLFYAALQIKDRKGGFLALLLLMQAGLNGVFLAKDLVLFYLFWEATLIPSILMLGMWGGEKRRQAAMKYLIYAVAGSFLMLISILAIKPLSGASSYYINDLILATPNLTLSTQVWLFIGFTLAFAVKLPLFPVHSWLPDFHEQNHPSGVADVAGTLYKVGGWGFFAWALPLLPDAAAIISPILLILAAFTAVYAAMIATSKTQMKSLLAFASLSHMGIVGVGIFGLHMAGLNGAIYLLAAQMLSTGGLFLISGMLYERRGSFELDDYGGLAKSAPALAGLTLFILFTSIGVPGLANFPGEFMSLMGAFQTNAWVAGFATLAVIAAGVYGVNMYQRLYQGEEQEATREISPSELALLAPLLAGILWLGLSPAPQLEQIEKQSQLVTLQLESSPQAHMNELPSFTEITTEITTGITTGITAEVNR